MTVSAVPCKERPALFIFSPLMIELAFDATRLDLILYRFSARETKEEGIRNEASYILGRDTPASEKGFDRGLAD